ncbi:hypothetical protein [Cetobacterium sp.]|uniref:hypothetical protein n=1 Tax=Cetobacterium sp. TaxID=2071632 RepID=UPI003F3CA178
MKKILILLVFILSIVSFSEEISDEVQNLTQNESLVEGVVVPAIPVTIAPVIENISISDISNEDFIISVIGSLEADPEIMAKMDVLGEEVDSEVQKENPNWKKVEQLYNELSVYTNKVSVNMMRTLKEVGLDKTEPNFEEEMNNEIMSDMVLDQGISMSSDPADEKEIMDAIKKGMTSREIARMEELSERISIEIEKSSPSWEQVENDYNELSKYTNKVTIIIMQVEKNKSRVQ